MTRLVPYEQTEEIPDRIQNVAARIANTKENWLDLCIKHVAPHNVYVDKGRKLARWLEHHKCKVAESGYDSQEDEFSYTFKKGTRTISTLKIKITSEPKDNEKT